MCEKKKPHWRAWGKGADPSNWGSVKATGLLARAL